MTAARRRGLAAVVLAAPALAPADPALLAELDRTGRALVAEGCVRPAESKTRYIGGAGPGSGVDEMQSVDCRSYRLAVYVAGTAAGGPPQPMALVVHGEPPVMPAGLGVGATPAEVQARLGPPATRRGDSLGYALDGQRPQRDTLTFEMEAGRVRAIAWSWHVD